VKDSHPQDAVWACTEALLLQPNNVKALYRRATALAALNSGMDLEAAVADLTKAAKISPSNKEVRRPAPEARVSSPLRTHFYPHLPTPTPYGYPRRQVREALQNLGAEHIAQRKRDQALYGAGLRKGARCSGYIRVALHSFDSSPKTPRHGSSVSVRGNV
jgi:tetratricopeptide (TPR) repeat protein